MTLNRNWRFSRVFKMTKCHRPKIIYSIYWITSMSKKHICLSLIQWTLSKFNFLRFSSLEYSNWRSIFIHSSKTFIILTEMLYHDLRDRKTKTHFRTNFEWHGNEWINMNELRLELVIHLSTSEPRSRVISLIETKHKRKKLSFEIVEVMQRRRNFPTIDWYLMQFIRFKSK